MSETTAAPAATEAPPVSPIKAELDAIRSAQADAVLEVEEQPRSDMYWITVRPRSIVPVATLLRDQPSLDYKLLVDLTCVDRPETPQRFNVTYVLYSVTHNKRIQLRVRVAEGEPVPTVSGVFACADWAEREVYDLFGVRFEGHPNLTRIELPDDWDGHPLRKDYPTVGRRPVILYNDVKDIL